MLNGFAIIKIKRRVVLKKISVVISTYTKDRLSYVLECINSLKKQSLQPKEVILVLDPDQDLIEFYKPLIPSEVRVIVSKGFGLSNARNTGVKNSEGEIIAFIDDDAIAHENWLENLAKNYEDPSVVGVGGFVKPVWESKRPIWFPKELDWIVGCSYNGLPRSKTFVRNPIGCNMSFRKAVFDKIGYFSCDIGRNGTKLISGEETEFSLRVLKNFGDFRIIYDSAVIVCHKVPRDRTNLKYLMKRALHGGLSIALIVNSIKSNSINTLSTENKYLSYLFKYAIPLRLRRILKLKNILQLLVLFMAIFIVAAGYLIGKSKG